MDGRPAIRLRLPPERTLADAVNQDPRLGSTAMYRVEYEKGWRILGISNTGIGADMEGYLRELNERHAADRR